MHIIIVMSVYSGIVYDTHTHIPKCARACVCVCMCKKMCIAMCIKIKTCVLSWVD